MFDRLGCDYMIMGQHFMKSEQTGPYTGTPTDDESRIREYVDIVIEGMKTGMYSYLAHPDLINYQGLDSVYECLVSVQESTIRQIASGVYHMTSATK